MFLVICTVLLLVVSSSKAQYGGGSCPSGAVVVRPGCNCNAMKPCCGPQAYCYVTYGQTAQFGGPFSCCRTQDVGQACTTSNMCQTNNCQRNVCSPYGGQPQPYVQPQPQPYVQTYQPQIYQPQPYQPQPYQPQPYGGQSFGQNIQAVAPGQPCPQSGQVCGGGSQCVMTKVYGINTQLGVCTCPNGGRSVGGSCQSSGFSNAGFQSGGVICDNQGCRVGAGQYCGGSMPCVQNAQCIQGQCRCCSGCTRRQHVCLPY